MAAKKKSTPRKRRGSSARNSPQRTRRTPGRSRKKKGNKKRKSKTKSKGKGRKGRGPSRIRSRQISEREGDRILAERLYAVREHQGVTRVVVAEETGIPYESLTGYELGDQRPPFSRIRLLAIYYGISLDYFAGRTDRLTRRRD